MGWAQSLAESWDRTGTEPGRAAGQDGHGAGQSCRTGWAQSLTEPRDGPGARQSRRMGTEPSSAVGQAWSLAEPWDGHGAWQNCGTGRAQSPAEPQEGLQPLLASPHLAPGC